MSLVKKLVQGVKEAKNAICPTTCLAVALAQFVLGGCAPDDSTHDSDPKDTNKKSYFITAEGPSAMKAGDNYFHDADSDDPEGDSPTYDLVTDAPFLTIDPDTGVLSGQAQASDIGQVYDVQISVTDGKNSPSYQDWTLAVSKADNPVITTSGPTDSALGYNYNYDADATDPAGHPLTWSLGTAPTGATINSSTGEVNWTPSLGQERQNNTLEIIASNAYGGSATENKSVYTRGRESITNMTVEDLHTGVPAENAVVTITTTYDTYVSNPTDALGNVTGLDNIVDGTHNMNVTCTNFYESNQNIEVSEAKQVAGKLDGITYEIVSDSFDMDLFDRCYRSYDGDTFVGAGNGKSQRPTDEDAANWNVYVDTNDAYGSSVPITQTMIDNMRDPIDSGDLITMSRGKLNFTTQEGTNPPAYGTDKTVVAGWNDTLPGGSGSHHEYMDGNEIYSGNVSAHTTAPSRVYKHEWYQVFGARHDDTIPEAKKPLTILGTAADYTQADIVMMYYNFTVKPGSTSPDNRPGLANE